MELYNPTDELLGFADVEYGYDENGNMIQKKVGTVAVNYVYNPENRLVKVEDDLTETVIAEYYYDPFGRRLWKEVGGTKTYFFYSDKGLIGEYDVNGNELTTYGYKPDSTWTTDPLFLKQGLVFFKPRVRQSSVSRRIFLLLWGSKKLRTDSLMKDGTILEFRIKNSAMSSVTSTSPIMTLHTM